MLSAISVALAGLNPYTGRMIGIIGAMEEEVKLLRQALQNPVSMTKGELTFWTGELSEVPVVLVQCGIGKVNAAAACTLLIEKYSPQMIINTGSAGGLAPNLTFGDILVATTLVQHDMNVTAFGYALGQVPGLPARFASDKNLAETARRCANLLHDSGEFPSSVQIVLGQIGSGDTFVHQPDYINQLKANFPEMSVVEMEGAAIAQVCHLFRIPFVVIRAVSDVAGKESPMTFDEFLPLASQRSSQLVRQLIKELSHGKNR